MSHAQVMTRRPHSRVPVVLGLGALMWFLYSGGMAFADGETPAPALTITFLQAALIGFGYFISQGPWIIGLSFVTFYRPLVAGLVVGIIMGDPGKGALIGAAINLVYLGFISAGGAIPGDPALAGWVGTTIALAGNLDYGAALALAVPIGLLGTIIWNARMTVNAIFAHRADAAADRGDVGGVVRANILWPQLFLFAITAIPVTVAVYIGSDFIGNLIAGFPAWVLNGLAIAGGVLPALGIAMNMMFIFRGSAIPYFFLGYFAMVVLGGPKMTIMVLAVVGVAVALIHVTLLGDRVSGSANKMKIEKKPRTNPAETGASS